MDLYLAVEQRLGMRLLHRWWDQTALDSIGIKAGHVESDTEEETGTEELEGERE